MSLLTTQTHTSTINILIVDDQKFIQKTIQTQLDQELDLKVVGCATNGHEAIAQVEKLNPNVVIIDLEMPGMDGLTATKIIRDRFDQTQVLVFSSHDDREYINRAIQAGAKGYLLKGIPANELANAIRAINQGYFQLSPGLLEKLVISINNATQVNSYSLEQKLLLAFKRFKQETDKQIDKVIAAEVNHFENRHGLNIDAYMRSFNQKCNQNEAHLKQVELRFYQFILINIVAWFIFIAYWIVNS